MDLLLIAIAIGMDDGILPNKSAKVQKRWLYAPDHHPISIDCFRTRVCGAPENRSLPGWVRWPPRNGDGARAPTRGGAGMSRGNKHLRAPRGLTPWPTSGRGSLYVL